MSDGRVKERVKWCAALTTACLCMASPARADKEAIALEYEPATGCPDRAEFVARVHAFTSKAEIVNDDSAARRKFEIRVSRIGSAVRGELTIDDHVGRTARAVSGATCDEVVSALALATAIAIDPDALGAEPATSPSPAAPPPPPKPKPPPPAKPIPPSKPAHAMLTEPIPKSEPRRPLFDLSLGARLGDTLAPFPKLDASAELGTTYLAPLELHLGAAFGPKQHNAEAEFSDWVGWLGAGYRLSDLEPLSVWASANVELGRVRATGRNVTPALSSERMWSAVDVGLCARLDGPGRLFFQAFGAGRAPLLLQRYVVQENTGKLQELHQVEQLGYLVSLSVGMHFL
jgi:hypothetical protein